MWYDCFTKNRPRLFSPAMRGTVFIVFIVTLFLGTRASAQLAGSYTICATGGCSYSSIDNAVADLVSKGISASVVFNVAPGTYAESVSIGAITGASSKNTITFLGAGRTSSYIKDTSAVISFNKNCSYVTFSQFTITNTGSAEAVYAYYCNYCAVLNCNLVASSSCCGYVIYDYYTNHFTVSDNHISGGYYGIYILSAANSSIYSNGLYSNNRVVQFAYYAWYIYYANFNEYIANVTDSSVNGYGYGIVS